MDFLLRHFAITGWKRVLYAFLFLLLCWQLSKFYGNWKDGVTSIFYYIHAPFHEIGHNLAGMARLPEPAVILAGSVFQVLTPILIGLYLFVHGDGPAVSLCLGWLGFATFETAAYMYDAPIRKLTLVTFPPGSEYIIHDFEYLFTRWHCMHRACRIAEITASIGFACVFTALVLIVVMFILGFFSRPEKN